MRLAHSFLALFVAVTAVASPRVTAPAPVRPQVAAHTILDLPVTFERNAGQFSADVDFVSRTQGQAMSINAAGATVLVGDSSGPREEIRLRFAGARSDAAQTGGRIVSYANYITGNDRSRWLTGVTAHESVRYDGIYEGIDVEYHARRGALEYDIIVAPGADFRKVALAVDGAAPVLDRNGDLVLCSSAGEIRHRAPHTYQVIGGKEVSVESRYDVRGDRIAFAVGEYDRSQPLIIDPILDFARGVFPLHRLVSNDLTRDSAGNLYMVATVWSPTATNFGGVTKGLVSDDVLVAKLNPTATQVLFSTFLGGSADESAPRVALGAGDVFVTGNTQSGDFPTTAGAFGEIVKGTGARAFVARLDGTTGAVEYSTYLERFLFSTAHTTTRDIAVDAFGHAIVSGTTSSNFFPVTPGTFYQLPSGSFGGAFLTKLAADGKSLVWSTYVPVGVDAVTVDPEGFIYVGGQGAGVGFPATEGSYQSTPREGWANALIKLTADGAVVFATRLPATSLVDIAVDSQRNIVMAMVGDDTMPVTPTSYQKVPAGGADFGIFKLSASGATLLASTFLGGAVHETPRGIAVGPSDSIYLTGRSTSGDVPMVNSVQGSPFLTGDTVLAKFDSSLSTLQFSSYYGPSFAPVSVLDEAGNIYLLVVNGGKEEDGIWLRGSQVQYGHYATTQIARILMGPATHGFEVDYLERKTGPANKGVDGRYHVRGHGFQQGARLLFDNNPAQIIGVYAGGTTIKFVTPGHDLGTVDVKVENPDNSSIILPSIFTYQEGDNYVDTVTGTMDTLGNGTVTLTATRLPPGTPVVRADERTNSSVGGKHDVHKQILGVSGNSVTFKLGPMPNITDTIYFSIPHPDDIGANAPTRLEATNIHVTRAPSPAVTEVRPTTGVTSGGGNVTVIGSNFHPDARVVIGGVYSRTVTFVNSATVVAAIPPNTGGPVEVKVINPDHSSGALPNGFTYRGITSVSPTSGPISGGTQVIINGAGFVAPVSVSFGGVAATNVTLQSATEIRATTGAHPSGFVDVVVTSGSDTFTLPDAYRYMDPGPGLGNVSPDSGPDTGGTSVSIFGSGFLPGVKVFFNNIPATSVTRVSSTQIDAVTPASPAGPASVKIENTDGQYTSLIRYTYTGIKRLDPLLGSPGTLVKVFGGGFTAGATVTLDGTPADNVQFINSGEIRFNVPTATPGIVDVVVTSGALTLTKVDGFRILAPPPTITGFTPITGLPGSEVIITGTNFVDVTAVTFTNNLNADFTVDSPTQITAIVPTFAQTGVLKVKTDSGTATSAASYTVENAAAEIESISPAAGQPGTVVTITGAKMGGATSVKFDGVEAASFTLNGTTEIQAVVPEGGSTGPICITTPGPFTGCSATSFRYPPVIDGFTPANGVPGDAVTITGVDFVNVASVQFNSIDAPGFVVNPGGTSITVNVPAAATTGPITVTTDAGTGASATQFGVRPVITGFTPARSGVGTTITINGLRLGGTTSVSIGGAAATFTIVSDSQLQAQVPANAVDGPIFVSTPGGSATSATNFQVALTPVPTSFSPIKGSPGTTVIISGRNFTSTTSVRFNGTPATFTIISDTQINAVVPAAATTGPISMSNSEGQGATADSFYLPPVLSSFAPNAGSIGSTVVLNGNNFNGTTFVAINGTSAAFTVNAQDKITLTVPAGATNGTILVTTPGGSVTSALSFTVTSASTPTVSATATSTTLIAVSWTGDATHSYQVLRAERKGDPLTVRATITGNNFNDTAVVPGKTYLYTIRNLNNGLIGNADAATTILFTDDPLTTGLIVKQVHLTQVRSAVNAMRSAAGLPAKVWTDPVTLLFIRSVHINEMRTALSEAYTQLYQHVTFTDQPLPPAMVVRAAHLTELRAAVK